MTNSKTWEEEILKDLDHPVWGLKDSSNTNKARYRIIGIVQRELDRKEEQTAIEEKLNITKSESQKLCTQCFIVGKGVGELLQLQMTMNTDKKRDEATQLINKYMDEFRMLANIAKL